MNVAQLLLRGAERNPVGLALKYGADTSSYPQLADRVQRLTRRLIERGVKPGDRVVLDLPNRPELVEMMWTCFWGGFVVVPLNWQLHPSEVAYIVENAQASAIMVADETIDNAKHVPGDVDYFDPAGYLHLTDRAKDVVISGGGSNIHPREVEEVLHHHAAVKEASVVEAPSSEWGESVVAFVVLHPGTTATAQELIEHCRQNLAFFKKPSQILFVDDLPKNATGKVLKHELKDSLAEASAR
jgi:acyl-CoA synthetase (AMP-forming)/AMP-acid ligase II